MRLPSHLTLPFAAGLCAGVVLCLAGRMLSGRDEAQAAGDAASGKERASAGPRYAPDWGGLASRMSENSPPLEVEALRLRLRSIAAIGDPLDRNRALLALASRLRAVDFPAALEACRRLQLPAGSEEMEVLLSAWVRADRPAALEFAKSDPTSLRTVLNLWSASDPEGAHAWVQAREPKGLQPGPLLGIVIPAIAGSDGPRAMELLSGMPREDRWMVFHQMVSRLVQQDEGAIRAWVATVPEKLRGEAVAQVVKELPASRAAEAFAWLQGCPEAMPTANAASLFRGWADVDASAAREAWESLPPGRLRQEALRGLAIKFSANGDSAAALELLKQAPGEVDDGMVENWVNTALAGPGGPAAALALLNEHFADVPDYAGGSSNKSAEDAELADAIYEKTLRRWLRKDSAAATSWIQSHPAAAAAGAATPAKPAASP